MAKLISLDQAGLSTWVKYLGPKCAGPEPFSFFLSFEDALLAVLREAGLEPGRTLLFPSFYCMEVVHGLEKRGYRVQFYETDNAFHPVAASLERLLQTERPALVCLYHAWGMRRALPVGLPEGMVLIEDHAHSLLDPSEIRLTGANHFVLDSLRKVTNRQGSRLFSKQALKGKFAWAYRLRLLALYFGHRLSLSLARLAGSSSLFEGSESFFDKYSRLIGSHLQPAAGFWWDRFLFERLNISRVKKDRSDLAVSAHEEALSLSAKSHIFFRLDLSGADLTNLRSYPVGLSQPERGDSLLRFLAKRGVFLDFMFADCPACRERRYLMLPLGPGVARADLVRIFHAIKSFEEELSA